MRRSSRSSNAEDEENVNEAIARAVHQASALAKLKREEKLDATRVAIRAAHEERSRAIDVGKVQEGKCDALEETRVTSDGASGGGLWLLACAMIEGANASEVKPALDELVKLECDMNARGNRPQHGKGITALSLLCSMLERRRMSPMEARIRQDLEIQREAQHEGALKELEAQGQMYVEAVKAIQAQVRDREEHFVQEPSAIVDFATALLAAGASPEGTSRMRPETSLIADSRIAPYVGMTGTEGSPLFFCALAVISGAGEETLVLAARLIAAGASANTACSRPGPHACCGTYLTPLTVLCAALESSEAYEMTYAHKARIARLGGLIIQGCGDINLTLESSFSHRPSLEEIEVRRIAPVEVQTDLKGPALFILACAIAEGAGPPAVALMDVLLAGTKTVGDIVGARPHHGKALPLLTMVVDAIDASAAFNSHGFIETASWWDGAVKRSSVSDTASMMGSELLSGGGKRRLASVDGDDVASMVSYLPDINDAAFDGQGAIARKEQADMDRLRNLQKTQSEIAAEEARDSKAEEIARRIAEAEKQARGTSEGREIDAKIAEDELGDTESTLHAKGATQYIDEDGKTYVVGFTEEMFQTKSGKFGKIVTPEEYERLRGAAKIAREERWLQLIANAQSSTFAYMDKSAAMLTEINALMGLSEDERSEAITFTRSRHAMLDCIDLAKQLLLKGANPDVKMQLQRECSDQCAEAVTTPLNIVAGYISRGMTEVISLFDLLLQKKADINSRGLGPYPILCTPLFALALAIFNGVEGADNCFEELLKRSVTVDRKALFPGDSSSTVLIQLIHALRAGRMDRRRILRLIKIILKEKGADPNLCCTEVYHDVIPTPYLEALKLTNTNVARVTYVMTQESSLQQQRAIENAELASVVHRIRDPEYDLAPNRPGEHEDLSDGELGKLEFSRIFQEISKLKAIQGSRADDVESVRSSMFGTVANFDFGAPFPSLPPRSGTSQYPPIFWAIEAAAKEGHKEALELVTLLLSLGARIDKPIEKNHHSWIEGSLVAMAVTAAVEAAAPLAPPETPVEYEQVNVGEVLLRLNQAAKQEISTTTPTMDMALPVPMRHGAAMDSAVNTKGEHNLRGVMLDTAEVRVAVVGGEKQNLQRQAVLDRLREPRADNLQYTVDAPPGQLSDGGTQDVDKRDFVVRLEGSRFGHSHVAARRDIPGLVRTTAVVNTSMEARALQLAREENKRREDEIKKKLVNAENNLEIMSTKSSDHNKYIEEPNAKQVELEYQANDTKTLDWDIAEQEEKLRAAAAKISIIPKGFDEFGGQMQPRVRTTDDKKAQGIDDQVEAADVEGMHNQSVSAEDEAMLAELYGDVDELGAPSEAGEEFADERVNDARDLIPEYVSNEPLTRQELETRHASRVKVTMAVAVEIIERASEEDINQFARNPLLADYGVGLVPYEYTPLFAALYGAATAKSQEQLATGITLAKMCMNKGAEVNKVGLHSMLAPNVVPNIRQQLKAHRVTRYKELRSRYVDEGDKSVLSENLDAKFVPKGEHSVKLRSYPLMWAVTAAIRADSRAIGCEQLVRHMLMQGADPTSISLQTLQDPKGVDMRAIHGRVLYLWGTAEDLFRVSQARYQLVMSVRMNIARMLSECGARSTYRSQTNAPLLTNRAEAAGKWLIQGSNGFGIVAPPNVTMTKERYIEPFHDRVARALNTTGERKQHVTIESEYDRRSLAIVNDQGADEIVGTWMWPTRSEAKVNALPEDDSRIVGFRPVPNYYHNKKLGEIELISADHVSLDDGEKDFIPAKLHSYSTVEAIHMAEKSDGMKEAIVTRELRQAQLLAIRQALGGDRSDIPQRIIDDTLLPTKFIR